MFRFGTGFGLLECRLSEFNDDIHGEPDSTHVQPSKLGVAEEGYKDGMTGNIEVLSKNFRKLI